MKTARTLVGTAAMIALLAACQKDELTVESTQPPSTHVCAHIAVTLNVDSLVHADPGPPTLVSMCHCDSLTITPGNIPANLTFVHWNIQQGTHVTMSDHSVIDTLTVSSELVLTLHESPGGLFIQVPVVVQVGPC